MLSKEKGNGGIKYSSVYFNSVTKTAINSEFNLGKSFLEILYRIDNWNNEGYGLIIESINGEYVNKRIFALTRFVTKTELFTHFTYLAKNLVLYAFVANI